MKNPEGVSHNRIVIGTEGRKTEYMLKRKDIEFQLNRALDEINALRRRVYSRGFVADHDREEAATLWKNVENLEHALKLLEIEYSDVA